MNKLLEKEINVRVSKPLAWRDIQSIIVDFVRQGLTFAISQNNNEFILWRAALPGDLSRRKNTSDRVYYNEVIEVDKNLLASRNFVDIWENGIPVRIHKQPWPSGDRKTVCL